MPIIAKNTGTFIPAPEGLHPAVCVDVVDLGLKDSPWGQKRKVRIVWEIAERMKDGKPFIASKQYTLSLHDKSSLHKDLRSWRGQPFTAEELEGFDLEKVLGVPCQILIVHQEKDGSVYGNVQAVTKADRKHVLKPSGQYVRVLARTGQTEVDEEREPDENEIVDDDIPF
jgi:hypothetical protein